MFDFHFLYLIELHIAESQSSVYSPTMAAAKSKSRIPSSGLTNELYFASHKPDGDNERTPPVLMRNKRRSPHLNIVPLDGPTNTRRPISSPARSTTYVLQQHHRVNTNIPHKQPSSPVHRQHQSPTITPMTLNKNRQTQQQQRIFSNHERLPFQTPATVDSSTFTPRTQIALTPRRTSPVVKNTTTKPATTYASRSPRVSIQEKKINNDLFMNINHFICSFFQPSRSPILHLFVLLVQQLQFNRVHPVFHFVLHILHRQLHEQSPPLRPRIEPFVHSRHLLNHQNHYELSMEQ